MSRPRACSARSDRPAKALAPASDNVRDALYASKIVSYAQGFMLFRAAAAEYGWNLNMGGIALMWRGGCIIRSAFLGKIKEAFDPDPEALQPPPRSVHRRRDRRRRAGLAANGLGGGRARDPRPRLLERARVLRRLPERAAAGEPDPGPARLLRRPHVRASRPPPRRVLPHELDGRRSHPWVWLNEAVNATLRELRRRDTLAVPYATRDVGGSHGGGSGGRRRLPPPRDRLADMPSVMPWNTRRSAVRSSNGHRVNRCAGTSSTARVLRGLEP